MKTYLDIKINELEIALEQLNSNYISTVYFTKDITPEALIKIYRALSWTPRGQVGIKMSTGEPPHSNYLRPSLVAPLIQLLEGTIVECNCAYKGKRSDTENHRKVISEHGFYKIAPVTIMDDRDDIPMVCPFGNNDSIRNFVGSKFFDFDSFLVLSHFKGHMMAGYGGALKNISIGFASSRGKSYIHSGGKSFAGIDGDHFEFLESMAKAAYCIMHHCKEKIAFINVMNNLSIDCDCNGHPAKPKINDIGILASLDPVALDQACIDLIYNCPEEGKQDLIHRIEEKSGIHTIEYAEAIGVGTRNYHLIDLDK